MKRKRKRKRKKKNPRKARQLHKVMPTCSLYIENKSQIGLGGSKEITFLAANSFSQLDERHYLNSCRTYKMKIWVLPVVYLLQFPLIAFPTSKLKQIIMKGVQSRSMSNCYDGHSTSFQIFINLHFHLFID